MEDSCEHDAYEPCYRCWDEVRSVDPDVLFDHWMQRLLPPDVVYYARREPRSPFVAFAPRT